ncbi:MAG: ATP-binding protein, partial [Actinomycetia bacterium]|nr:ATP-binding protein [Actinomycetes bacterium]
MSKTDTKKLLSFVTDLAGEKFLKVEKEIGRGYFILKISEAERRQAKHDIRSVEDIIVEMVRNSRDAGANQIFIATNKDSAKRREI